jgi:hypothetical protein
LSGSRGMNSEDKNRRKRRQRKWIRSKLRVEPIKRASSVPEAKSRHAAGGVAAVYELRLRDRLVMGRTESVRHY